MKRLKYYIFVIRWLWRNRKWKDTQQKYKAMNKEGERRGAAMSNYEEIIAREQPAAQGRDPKAVAKSLRWILNNIKDCGPNTFEHAIHGYVGEAIQILEKA